jgi:hypothetical protein
MQVTISKKKKLKILENPKNGLASRVIWRL